MSYKYTLILYSILTALLLSSCSTFKLSPAKEQGTLFIDSRSASEEQSLPYTPAFIIDEAEKEFNPIGSAKARLLPSGEEQVFIDPDDPVLYHAKQVFHTDKASYLNLIYRVHFPRTPFSLWPFHLAAGEHPGLLVVLTLKEDKTPILLTTVHTCGCYVAFIPFEELGKEYYPANWNTERQTIYGQQLPGQLPEFSKSRQLLLFIQSENHRVRDIKILEEGELNFEERRAMRILPISHLQELSTGSGTVSFFEESGPRRGYVKGSHKFFERLLMSWWTFDWRVGEDKSLLNVHEDWPPFYTSLKFWQRKDSDMKNFAQFLKYWGWRL